MLNDPSNSLGTDDRLHPYTVESGGLKFNPDFQKKDILWLMFRMSDEQIPDHAFLILTYAEAKKLRDNDQYVRTVSAAILEWIRNYNKDATGSSHNHLSKKSEALFSTDDISANILRHEAEHLCSLPDRIRESAKMALLAEVLDVCIEIVFGVVFGYSHDELTPEEAFLTASAPKYMSQSDNSLCKSALAKMRAARHPKADEYARLLAEKQKMALEKGIITANDLGEE